MKKSKLKKIIILSLIMGVTASIYPKAIFAKENIAIER